MKNLPKALLVLLFLSVGSYSTYAQKMVSEGKIIYEISYPDMMLDAEMLAMMPKESVVFFKGDFSRTDLNMGMGITSSSIFNSKTGEVIALTDLMGTKTAMKISAGDQKKSKEQNKRSQMKVILTGQTKEIAGYPCKRAVVKNDDDTALDIYFTENIKARTTATIDWKEINGFPMEYYLDQNGLKMKFTATKVLLENVEDSLFQIPEGYKMITQEEMMKMMGEQK